MPAPFFKKYFIPVWRTAPFLRLLVPLLIGIIAGNRWQIAAASYAIICFAIIALLLIAVMIIGKKAPLIASVFISLAIFLLGALLVYFNTTSYQPSFAGKQYRNGQGIVATLSEPSLPKEKSFKANATLQLLTQSSQLQKVSGSVLLYLQKDEKSKRLQYGSSIAFIKPLQLIKNAGNPGGFDYKIFAARQHIYYQVFLKSNEYEILPGNNGTAFYQWLYKMRNWVLNTITTYIPSPSENGVAQALLIGYRGDLDKTLVEQYANTGVVHIIAISGMHLGMIYGLLLLIFKPLGQSKKMRILSVVIIIAALWLFALITGAAPSITRAAVMFSVVALGGLLNRKTSSYNTLSAAAIALLVADPYALWNVGFQLSFAAVLSIAVFYRPILNWWVPANKILQHIWQMAAVTLAAQILTVPMAVYHFHQFPVYFLLANLIAVPLSAIALYGIILLLLLSGWPAVASVIGWLVLHVIGGLNGFITRVSTLPFTTVSQIQISLLQALLLYAVIAAFCWWWFKKQTTGLMAGLCFLALFLGSRSLQYLQTSSQQKIIIYNVPQHTAIDFVKGGTATFIGDSALTKPGFLRNFHLLPSRIYWQYTIGQVSQLDSNFNFTLIIGGQKMIVLRRQLDYRRSQPVTADILLISGNPPGNPFRILPLIRCSKIVLDGSNSAWRIAQWKSAADSLHLRLHSIPDDGAFVMEL